MRSNRSSWSCGTCSLHVEIVTVFSGVLSTTLRLISSKSRARCPLLRVDGLRDAGETGDTFDMMYPGGLEAADRLVLLTRPIVMLSRAPDCSFRRLTLTSRSPCVPNIVCISSMYFEYSLPIDGSGRPFPFETALRGELLVTEGDVRLRCVGAEDRGEVSIAPIVGLVMEALATGGLTRLGGGGRLRAKSGTTESVPSCVGSSKLSSKGADVCGVPGRLTRILPVPLGLGTR